jgi:hypothetical protein
MPTATPDLWLLLGAGVALVTLASIRGLRRPRAHPRARPASTPPQVPARPSPSL